MNTLDYIMTKYDLSGEGCIEIPNVTRLDLIRWVRELDFKAGAEIGVATGEFAKLLIVHNQQFILHGVDLWEPYEGYNDFTLNDSFLTMYDEAKRRLGGFKRFKFIKKLSMEAVKDFEDESLDFVYIDANHEEKYVYQDIVEWSRKVRKGGIVSGHDYINLRAPVVEGRFYDYGIKAAVQQYTKENNISPWFVLGAKDKTPNVMRENIRSWALVK